MPQLEQTEFFISQLFWLILTFSFLFIFLWRISLPKISAVLEKRANKIGEDIKTAKQYQTEAVETQTEIDNQLREAKLEAADLIKTTTFSFQEHASKEMEKLDKKLNLKINESSSIIEKNKIESLQQINDQIYEIIHLTVSKISNIDVSDDEVKKEVENIQQKVIH